MCGTKKLLVVAEELNNMVNCLKSKVETGGDYMLSQALFGVQVKIADLTNSINGAIDIENGNR